MKLTFIARYPYLFREMLHWLCHHNRYFRFYRLEEPILEIHYGAKKLYAFGCNSDKSFRFSVLNQEIGWENPKLPIFYRVGRKTVTQLIYNNYNVRCR